jgi:MIP family channel proteins
MRAPLAEFLGTFTLVFIGAGAGALLEANSAGLVGVALAHGLALLVIVYTWGSMSGAHVNPAVTLGAAITGRINAVTAIAYWIAQFAGGVAAAYLLFYLIGANNGNLGQTIGSLTPGIEGVSKGLASPIRTIIVEAILTFFLMTSVFASGILNKNGNLAGVAIGWVLTMDIIMGGPLTGASMNPARTFGPALVLRDVQSMSYVWMYMVGPFAGAAVGALLYDRMASKQD